MFDCILVDTVGSVVARPTAAVRVVGSIPARNKIIFVWPTGSCPGLAVCVCDFSMSKICYVHDTGIIPSVRQRFIEKERKIYVSIDIEFKCSLLVNISIYTSLCLYDDTAQSWTKPL